MKSPARDILTLLIRVTFAFLPLIASGETERHVVQRGETWWSICRDYGVEFEQLQQHNRWLESDSPCIAGLEVDVPLVGADGDRLLMRLHATDSRYVEALSLYDAGEYKKAVKACDKIIKNDAGPYAAIFLRGRAQLMRGKYGKAIDDFNSAEAISFSSLDDLRSQAFELKAEQDERRAAMWGGIALGVAAAAVTTAAVIAAENDDSGSAYSAMSMPYAGVADGYVAPSTGSNLSPGRILDNGTVITPAGNVLPGPDFPDPRNYDFTTKFTTDANGNLMMYNPGTAQYQLDMASSAVNVAGNYAANASNSTSRAIANAYLGSAISGQRIATMGAALDATPHYVDFGTSDNSSSSNIQSTDVSTSSTSSSGDYLSDYQSAEHRAKMAYESLTVLGGSVIYSDGSVHGSTGSRGNPGGSTVQLKMLLRNAQKDMYNIRMDALRAGVTIPQSSFETATVK